MARALAPYSGALSAPAAKLSAMRVHLSLLLAFGVLLGGCASTLKADLGSKDPAAYDALFPHYAELCAASQFKKRPGSIGPSIEGGGPGGHEVLYLNGVCRQGPPGHRTLVFCPAGTDPAEAGVGLSVNNHYKNAKWVATPGRAFFFEGLLKPGEPLTEQVYRRTVAQAQALGLYDGVSFHQEVFENQPADETKQDYMYMLSLGTDYALSYARDRYCARVPLTHEQMSEAIDYLNEVNAPYYAGSRDFHWSVFRDNCAHLARNTLAKAGIWHGWPVEQPWPLAVFSFPTPKNEFVNLMRRMNDMPIDDLEALYRDEVARAALMDEGIIATQPGGLAVLERAHQPNAIYDPEVSLIFYDDPATGRYRRRFASIESQPRYSDLRANLDHFAALYRKILADRKPVEFYLDKRHGESEEERTSFSTFYARYYDYMTRQSAAVEEMRRRLGAPK
jgi:hypothetical protein